MFKRFQQERLQALKKHLIEVRPHVFLSKNDPCFHEKNAFYHPNNTRLQVLACVELLQKGETKNAKKFLIKAKELGDKKSISLLPYFHVLPNEMLFHYLNQHSSFINLDNHLQSSLESRNYLVSNEKKRDKKFPLIPFLLSCCFFALLFLILSFFLIQFEKNDSVTSANTYVPTSISLIQFEPQDIIKKQQEIIHSSDKKTKDNPIFSWSVSDKDTSLKGVSSSFLNVFEPSLSYDVLSYLVVENALVRYKQVNGTFPKKLEELIQDYPHNYLSFIPNDFDYNRFYHTSNRDDFVLSVSLNKGKKQISDPLFNLDSPLPFTNHHKDVDLLTLSSENVNLKLTNHFYHSNTEFKLIPNGIRSSSDKNQYFHLVFFNQTKELGVFYDDILLTLYPTSYGEKTHLLKHSNILLRVDKPNGGNTVLGTKGFEMGDNYALHGTNDEEVITKEVTKGCIRLKNKDIENLFPYISIHTPFSFNGNSIPTKPLFQNGLPYLVDYDSISIHEIVPNKTFRWKN